MPKNEGLGGSGTAILGGVRTPFLGGGSILKDFKEISANPRGRVGKRVFGPIFLGLAGLLLARFPDPPKKGGGDPPKGGQKGGPGPKKPH